MLFTTGHSSHQQPGFIRFCGFPVVICGDHGVKVSPKPRQSRHFRSPQENLRFRSKDPDSVAGLKSGQTVTPHGGVFLK